MRHEKGSRSPGQVKKIHALASVLGLIDGSDKRGYYDMLESWGYKTSKDLSFYDAGKIIDRLEKDALEMGIWQKTEPKNKNKYNDFSAREGMAAPTELRTIEGLWDEVSYAQDKRKALRQFIENKFGICFIEWLDSKTAKKVIEALKAMKKRPKGGKKS